MMSAPLVLGIVFALFGSGVFLYGAWQLLRKMGSYKQSNHLALTLSSTGSAGRILMFGWEFPPFNSGGLGVACLGIVKALVKRGTPVTFVLPKQFPIEVSGVSVICQKDHDLTTIAVNSLLTAYLTSDEYSKNGGASSIYGLNLIDEVRRYGTFGAKVAKDENHEIIYAHDWLSFPAGMSAKRISGKPLIVHVHATEFDRSGSDSVNQDVYDIERAGMEYADVVVTVSEMTKNLIVNRYGIPRDKIEVVYNGIDDVTAPKEEAGESMLRLQALKDAGYAIVLFMGRVTLQKGPDYFVSAAKRVLAVRPNTIFVLAGSGDMQHRVIEQAATLGIADKIFFPGFLRGNDQYEAYKNADLFVMPSVSEPFGIAALEAMRAGVPVLLSKQSGISEVAPTAHLVDFWDTEKMAQYIGELLDNSLLRKHLVERGHIESAGLTWDRAAVRIQEIVARRIPD